MSNINLGEHTLEILRNNTESQGKMKGNIEILSERVTALTKSIDSHNNEFKNMSERIKLTLNDIDDSLKIVLVRLDSNPNSKIVENQIESDKLFSGMFNTALREINELTRFEEKRHEKIAATMTMLVKSVGENTKISLDKNERKWKFWTGVTILLFSLLGNILTALVKYLK